jgi:hypothetical protein
LRLPRLTPSLSRMRNRIGQAPASRGSRAATSAGTSLRCSMSGVAAAYRRAPSRPSPRTVCANGSSSSCAHPARPILGCVRAGSLGSNTRQDWLAHRPSRKLRTAGRNALGTRGTTLGPADTSAPRSCGPRAIAIFRPVRAERTATLPWPSVPEGRDVGRVGLRAARQPLAAPHPARSGARVAQTV